VSEPLPLAAASRRLRGKPGRPRAQEAPAPLGTRETAQTSTASVPALCPARLLDLAAAAAYLGLSPWTVRDLIAAGTLTRVRIPLPNGAEIRKVLLDRVQLDSAVSAWMRASGPGGAQEPR
jgi:hypothetical protein